MSRFDTDIEMLTTESHEEVQHLYAIEQLVAENGGEWNSEIQHDVLKTINHVAQTLQVLVFAVKTLAEDVKKDKEHPE